MKTDAKQDLYGKKNTFPKTDPVFFEYPNIVEFAEHL